MIRRSFALMALVGVVFWLGAGVVSAKSMAATVQLKPPSGGHMMAIQHAYGSAKIRYTAHDADINLTTDKLPKPAALHAKVYVVWTIRGGHSLNVGKLNVNGTMAGLHKMIMDTTFTSILVTAEQTVAPMHPMGTKVLVGHVMHH